MTKIRVIIGYEFYQPPLIRWLDGELSVLFEIRANIRIRLKIDHTEYARLRHSTSTDTCFQRSTFKHGVVQHLYNATR